MNRPIKLESDRTITFTPRDLAAFSRISHDRNPLHVDPDYARRTQQGEPVVFGILAVLACLSRMEPRPGRQLESIDVAFRHPVFTGVTYRIRHEDVPDLGVRLALCDGDRECLRLRCEFGEQATVAHHSAPGDTGTRADQVDIRTTPRDFEGGDLPVGQCVQGFYQIAPFSLEDLTSVMSVGHVVPPVQRDVLILCSYLIGMELPGRQALFSRLRLRFEPARADDHQVLRYRAETDHFDRTYGLTTISVCMDAAEGLVARGELKAFVRQKIEVAPLRRVERLLPVPLGRLDGRVVMVTGGSRGLGAAMVQALALEGCQVILNFKTGLDEAKALAQSLSRARGAVTLLQGDVGQVAWCEGAKERILREFGKLDALICNAGTPPLPLEFSSASVDRMHHYIIANLALTSVPLAVFGKLLAAHRGTVVAISSSFVEAPPPDLPHYVSLKSAVEGLIHAAARTHPQASFVIVRPPRLITDMNSNPLSRVGAMAPEIVAVPVAGCLLEVHPGRVRILRQFDLPPAPTTPDFSPPGDPKTDDEQEKPVDRPAQPVASVVVASTFTAEPIGESLSIWLERLSRPHPVIFVPFNQPIQELLNPSSSFAENRGGLNVLLLRFQDWLRDFDQRDEATTCRHLEQVQGELIRALQSFGVRARCQTLVIVCPHFPGTAELPSIAGLCSTLEEGLLSSLADIHGVEGLRSAEFHDRYGAVDIFDPVREEIAQIPYKDGYYRLLGTLVARRLDALGRIEPKVVVVDGDNTLWRGVCAEVGAGGIAVDGPHLALQHFLAGQRNQGMLLCLCSKNRLEDVEEVFCSREPMLLRLDDFTAVRVNWQPKSENLRALAAELKLGLDTFIFIDDNPVECAEVRAHCPEVLVIEWPQDPDEARLILDHYWVFDRFSPTEEDRRRAEFYRTDLLRQEHQARSHDFASFLESLDLEVEIQPIGRDEVPRVAQLTVRTNQFNSTTIRRSTNEVQQIFQGSRLECLTVKVRDRFGDYGLVGAMIFEATSDSLTLESLLLSCRVLGRGVEHRMMAALGLLAADRGVGAVKIMFVPSPRNTPVRQFLKELEPSWQEPHFGGECFLSMASSVLKLARMKMGTVEEPIPRLTVEERPPDLLTKTRGSYARFDEIARLSANLQTLAKDSSTARGGAGVSRDVVSPIPVPGAQCLGLQNTRSHDRGVWTALTEIIARIRGIEADSLSPDSDLEFLLGDSFAVVELTVEIGKVFHDIPVTLFFEHTTLGSIADYLAERQDRPPGRDAAGASISGGNDVPIQFPDAAPAQARVVSGLGRTPREDVAIIGMSGLFPQARDLWEFWDHLAAGRSCIREVPLDRWDTAEFFDPEDRAGTSHSKWGGFLDDVASFDPAFFHISPAQAELMDPQQRFFLQVAWAAMEDAGCTRKRLPRNTGVFVGVIAGDYGLITNEAAVRGTDSFRGSDYYQIANRVSYFFDLHGPSLAVDSACSSSATCLHLACESLRHGECEAAIVGGVNLFLHPGRFIQYSRMGILSRGPACRPFGKDADGTVFGEGVGALLLKPLWKAEQDGDRIHAVIKSTVVNSGGKTNGFTVPNPESQAELIAQAIRRAGVDPETISYVEAHGTGTALGDPIEIRGLDQAFRECRRDPRTSPPEFTCSIGSLKGNIGHLESCAAIAGVIKIVLQMRHGLLVPSLNASSPNPLIPFHTTPFTIQQSLQPWPRRSVNSGGSAGPCPHRAGLSSFGAGGSNAHIILEEYVTPRRPIRRRASNLFVLSAQDEERLRIHAGRMAVHLERESIGGGRGLDLDQLAYTLQVGREAMPARLGIVASEPSELVERWRSFSHGETSPDPRVFSGSQSVTTGSSNPRESGEGGDARLLRAASRWAAGGDLDPDLWEESPGLISLPTYPFAKERYWVADDRPPGGPPTSHPSLGNLVLGESLGRGLVYEKTLSLRDPTVLDHRVRGRHIFPAVGYLAMAHGFLRTLKARTGSSLRNVQWSRTLEVGDSPLPIRFVLERGDDGLRFDVRVQDGQVERTFAHGLIDAIPTEALDPGIRISIESVRERCPVEIGAGRIYRHFEAMGLDYGPHYRGLVQVRRNHEEAIGELRIPEDCADRVREECLHPTLLDGALQVAVLLTDQATATMVPFSLQEITFFHPHRDRSFVHVTRSGPDLFDLDLLDEDGLLCIRMRGLLLRAMKDPLVDFFFAPHWVPFDLPRPAHFSPEPAGRAPLLLAPLETGGLADALTGALGQDVLRIELGTTNRRRGERAFEVEAVDPEALASCLDRLPEVGDIYFLGGLQLNRVELADSDHAARCQEQGVLSLFRVIKALTSRPDHRQARTIKVVTNGIFPVGADEIPLPFGAGLAGLCQVMAKEFLPWRTVCLDLGLGLVEGELPREALGSAIDLILRDMSGLEGVLYAFRGGRGYVRTLLPMSVPEAVRPPFRERGVYLILGGTGGLGRVLSRYLAETVRARLVLLGRRQIDPTVHGQVAEIEALGGEALYLSVDATDLSELRAAVEQARSRFGAINGVVHSAIVLQDRAIVNMDEPAFRAAFAPKVAGSVNLYSATRSEPLDFLMFFSSISSYTANAGQCNYTAGCTFKDSFALAVDRVSPFPVKLINWGYWGSVGAVASDFYKTRLEAEGIRSIMPEEGIEAIRRLLAHPTANALAMKMERSRLVSMKVNLSRRISMATPRILRVNPHGEFSSPLISPERLGRYQDAFSKLEHWSRTLLIRTFQDMGVFDRGGMRYGRQELEDRLHIHPSYRPLFAALLEILINSGFLIERGNWVETTPDLDTLAEAITPEALAGRGREILETCPQLAPSAAFVQHCLAAYPLVLTGRKSPMEVIFPEGSKTLVEGIYRGNDRVDYHNHLASSLVADLVGQLLDRGGDGEVRILEIGAGTGASTRSMLESLRPYASKIRYFYTDISSAFVNHGAGSLGADHPFMTFQILDIEREIGPQGFDRHTFDLVVATNVLHATRDVGQTLNRTKTLLKAGGLVVLNEDCQVYDFATMTFGLTKGWWLFEDKEYRLPHAPLLGPASWRNLLSLHGFQGIATFGRPDIREDEYAQVVIFAQSDGWIMERSPLASPSPAVVPPEVRSEGEKSAVVTSKRPPECSDGSRAETVSFVKGIFAEVLKLPARRMDEKATFDTLGVDSLVSMEIVRRLGKEFAGLPITLLFEYMTLETLADYLAEHHGDALKSVLASKRPVPARWNTSSGPENSSPKPRTTASVDDGANGREAPRLIAAEPESTRHGTTTGTRADIAIIGVSGRYPMAADLDEFWENLRLGRSCITEIPEGRWDWREHFDPRPGTPGKSYSRWGGFIDDVDRFDPLFFAISPKEAASMDPQERLFLSTVWAAFEDAGYTRRTLASDYRRVGVFVGVMNSDYAWHGAEAHGRHQEQVAHTSFWSCANRISWCFDFRGPSLAVDTACSSSLTAIHLAWESLRNGSCDMAVAGGVNTILHPGHYIRLSALNMLSRDGACRTFAAGAEGFVPGEGVGAVVMKPLDRAVSDGDQIYGVIRASEVNAGGRTGGYTVPNPNAQSDLVTRALRDAGIESRSVSYMEAHGTGTALGDPIEIVALTRAFAATRVGTPEVGSTPHCILGSVKPNIGHLESAAGVAGLTKILLQFKHRQIVPSLHADQLNPTIDFASSPFTVSRELRPWSSPGREVKDSGRIKMPVFPRRAGISSFGAGGANAHMILEEYVETNQSPPETEGNEPQLIVLSARDEARLKDYANKLANFLRRTSSPRGGCEAVDSGEGFAEALIARVAALLGVASDDLDPATPLRETGLDPFHLNLLKTEFCVAGGANGEADLYRPEFTLNALIHDWWRRKSTSDGRSTGPARRIATRLADLAYTLQIGREPMACRLAAEVTSIAPLIGLLEAFTGGRVDIHGMHLGHASDAATGPHAKRLVDRLVAERRLQGLARLWVAGAEIDWHLLYKSGVPGGSARPRRISLPTYPFALERCWLPQEKSEGKTNVSLSHPFLTRPVQTPSSDSRPPRRSPRRTGRTVAVIGAGMAGLATAKCLLEDGHEPVVFEKSDRIGGIWAFNPGRKGGAYRSTRLQTSKYTSLFSDFPPSEGLSLFPEAEELCGYLDDYAENFNLKGRIIFHTELNRLERARDRWRLRLVRKGQVHEPEFEAVAVCSGAFWNPVRPRIPGQELFHGMILHSCEYKEPSLFKNRRVLVIGNGVSGMDIACDAVESAAQVFWSWRTPKMIIPRMFGFTPNDCSITPVKRRLLEGMDNVEVLEEWRASIPRHLAAMEAGGLMPTFPLESRQLYVNDRIPELVAGGKLRLKPELARLSDHRCHFLDDTSEEVDIVVYCTGYEAPSFPFFPEVVAKKLYKSQFHPDHPDLSFMGLKPASLCVIPTIELEARWFSKILSDQCQLPDAGRMRHETEEGFKRGPQTQSLYPEADSSLQDIEMAASIDAFPDPVHDWPLYWELINLPRIPTIYRVVGPNRWPEARSYLREVQQKIYVNRADPRLERLKHQILSSLGTANLRAMTRAGQITPSEFSRAMEIRNPGQFRIDDGQSFDNLPLARTTSRAETPGSRS